MITMLFCHDIVNIIASYLDNSAQTTLVVCKVLSLDNNSRLALRATCNKYADIIDKYYVFEYLDDTILDKIKLKNIHNSINNIYYF